MAAPYSNLKFFRTTPNLYLQQFFQDKGITLAVDFESLAENDANALQKALNQLNDKQISDIEAAFQNINALACEGGITTLIDEANFHNDSTFIKLIADIEGFHAKAMWAFLVQPTYWQGAAMFLHADNVSPSYWRKRNDLPCLPPQVENKDINALENAISDYFSNNEGRGKNCKVEVYRRDQKEYFFAYPEDFAQSSIEWIGNSLKNQAHHPAFEIIFVYCESEGALDIYAPKNSKIIDRLQAMFAKHILKMESLPEATINKQVYKLDTVIGDDFEFKIEPTSGIASALVTQIRVTSWHNKKERTTIEADTQKNPNAVFERLETFNLPPYYVSQIKIKVTFETIGKTRAKTRTVYITHPNYCALNYDGNDLKIRQMLARSGLEPTEMAASK